MNTQTGRNLIRLVVALGFMAMVAVAPIRSAYANQSGPTVYETSMFQIGVCGLAGGTATVDQPGRSVGGGLYEVIVRCTGGVLGGMVCTNIKGIDPYCFIKASSAPGSEDLPTLEVVNATVDVETVADVDISQDAEPVIEVVDPVVDEEPVVENEPVDPLPPVVDESPVTDSIPDVDIVEADPVIDESAPDEGQDLPQIETSDDGVIPVVEELPVLEPAP